MHLMTLGGSKKISGALCRCLAVSLTGYYVAVCVCYDLTCRGFKHFSTPGHSLSFLVKSCKGVISIYIYIHMYVCEYTRVVFKVNVIQET